ncbi:MAG: hypothetical protein WKF41_11855 [Gaiellaceae bacterium]
MLENEERVPALDIDRYASTNVHSLNVGRSIDRVTTPSDLRGMVFGVVPGGSVLATRRAEGDCRVACAGARLP